MNKLHDLIERSAFRKGEYNGYCHGVQAIRKGGLGWTTYGLVSPGGRAIYVTAPTLQKLGEKLDAYAPVPIPAL
jgi:hypothetical protein